MSALANRRATRERPAAQPATRRDAIAPTHGFKVSVIPPLQRAYAFLR